MKKLSFVLSVLIFCACNSSDKKTTGVDSDTNNLKERLAGFVKVTDDMDLDKTMDFIYPKIFTIVPREELVKAMKEGFDNEKVKIDIDGVRVDSIYPVFEAGKGKYAKIKYSMTMLMNIKSSPDDETNSAEIIHKILAEKYGEENVKMVNAGLIKVNATSPMIAAKDEHAKEWSFVSLNDEDPMFKKLFSQEIVDKLATYN